MYAQLVMFDAPQSPEFAAAADRADNERIRPLLDAHPEIGEDILARIELRQPDGARAVLVITRTEDTLDKAIELITTSELLTGEDPALLPGPSRAERYEVSEFDFADTVDAK